MRAWSIPVAGALLSQVALAQLTPKWSEGEHLELGDEGTRLACDELGIEKSQCPVQGIRRHDQKVSFTYGELTVSADYYMTSSDLYMDRKTGIKKILRCAAKLKHQHPVHDPKKGTYWDCNIPGVFNMPGYLEVVSANYDHFGWHNMKAYIHYHQAALKRARDAFLLKTSRPEESQLVLEQALIQSAFADHYLSDAFAAGHIRLPRIQLKTWAKKNLSGPFRSARGDVMAIILHDNESRDLRTGYEQGFRVRNARGDAWLTRGDQYLHIDTNRQDPAFVLPLKAQKASFKEFLIAWQTGLLPDGEFQATRYVPFHDDLPLVRKLAGQTKTLYASLPFYQKFLVSESDLEKMVTQLPDVFRSFRADIQNDLKADPELERRLPRLYLDAHLRID